MKTWVMMFALVITACASVKTQWEVKRTSASTDYSHKGCFVSVRNDGLGLAARYSVLGIPTDDIVSTTKENGKEDIHEKAKEVVVGNVAYGLFFSRHCSDAILSLPSAVRRRLNTQEMQKHLLFKRPVLVTSQQP